MFQVKEKRRRRTTRSARRQSHFPTITNDAANALIAVSSGALILRRPPQPPSPLRWAHFVHARSSGTYRLCARAPAAACHRQAAISPLRLRFAWLAGIGWRNAGRGLRPMCARRLRRRQLPAVCSFANQRQGQGKRRSGGLDALAQPQRKGRAAGPLSRRTSPPNCLRRLAARVPLAPPLRERCGGDKRRQNASALTKYFTKGRNKSRKQSPLPLTPPRRGGESLKRLYISLAAPDYAQSRQRVKGATHFFWYPKKTSP